MSALLTRLRGDRGAQAVEFAILVLPLLYLLYGAIAFGFTLNAQETATQIAREGARAAAICGVSGGCTATANARMTSAAPSGFTIVSTTVTECASATADATVVVVTQPPLTFVPFLTSSTSITGKATTPCGG